MGCANNCHLCATFAYLLPLTIFMKNSVQLLYVGASVRPL